jgi:hypothetical protein
MTKSAQREPNMKPTRSDADQETFLRADFCDTLRWMLVGAITWKAAPTKECCPNLDVVGMYTSLLQSRNLYEFYYDENPHFDDDARASEFASSWDMKDTSPLYKKYMGPGMPVNNRISHLVWERSKHSGGTLVDECDHLKKQVLPCAHDLIEITNKFIPLVTPESVRAAATFALDEARKQACLTAKKYGIDDPFDV